MAFLPSVFKKINNPPLPSIFWYRGDEVLRLDMKVDEKSIDKYFQKFGGMPADLRSIDAILKIIEGMGDEADQDQIDEAQRIVARMTHASRTDSEEIETYKIKDQAFLGIIEKIVKDVEQYFVSRGANSMAEVVDERQTKYYQL